MALIDWTDPCARAAALRDAYYALISGGKPIEVSYQDGGTERSVKYSSTKLDMSRLWAEYRAAAEECDPTAAEADGRRRYALRGGSLRRTIRSF